jgi:pyroglutamyl-peptidase
VTLTAALPFPARRPRLLLVGFGPTPSQPLTPGPSIVRTLQAEAPALPDLVAIEAPNAWAAGHRTVIDALKAERFDAVLLIDRAAPEDGVLIAEAAANAASTLLDCQGVRWPGPALAPGGPAARRATTPVRRLAAAIAATGAPVRLAPLGGDDPANRCFYALLARPQGPPVALMRAPAPLEALRRAGVAGPALLNAGQAMAATMAALQELAVWASEERAKAPG